MRPVTIPATDNVTKRFDSVPAFQVVPRSAFVKAKSFMGLELATNMLEWSEYWLLHVGFWTSCAYSIYQLILISVAVHELVLSWLSHD